MKKNKMVKNNKQTKQKKVDAMHNAEKMKTLQTRKVSNGLEIVSKKNFLKNTFFSVIALLIVAGILFSFSGATNNSMNGMDDEMMALHTISLSDTDKKVTLYKDPNCGCCEGYADELRRQGFDVTVVKDPNMSAIKQKYGISSMIESCHTSVFENGYIVEGHTPIEAVMKMLNEKPQIDGIGMGGMPSGSVGMPGQKREAFKVYTIEKDSNNLFMTV